MSLRQAALLAFALHVQAPSTTPGDKPPPPGMSLVKLHATRLPQPVRVDELLGGQVLCPAGFVAKFAVETVRSWWSSISVNLTPKQLFPRFLSPGTTDVPDNITRSSKSLSRSPLIDR